MKTSAISALLVFLFACAGCADLAVEAPRNAPSLIVVNAKVITVDDRSTIAQAFAVRDGKFLAVGSNEEIRALARAGTQIIDAQGRTVTPGLNDGHIHMVRAGFTYNFTW